MAELLKLAERCEQAVGPTDSNAGPCRALEIEIHDTVFGRDTYNCGGDGQRGIPQYARSLDAAMTLVPEPRIEGEHVTIGLWTGNGVHAKHVRATAWVSGSERVFAATPALALCAAALRAKAAAQ